MTRKEDDSLNGSLPSLNPAIDRYGLTFGFPDHAGKLKLLNLTKRVHDLLQITHTDKIFEVYQDEEAALNSF
jgi:hypothetical protein